MSDVRGLHALVTGGGTGIGAAIAEALLRGGAQVTLAARDATRLEAQAAQWLGLGSVRTVALDVTDEAAVARVFAAVGPLDILVNNAGAVSTAPLPRITPAEWRRMLDVNLTGTFLCTQAALPGMAQRGFGRVVNVASTAALKGYAYVAAYCAAKHGVLGLTRALALEYARRGVTVNAVCPGYTDTAITDAAVAQITAKTGRSADDAVAALASANPQQRLVQPAEVADAVLHLCGRGASAVNGVALAVSGGEWM
ncbi:MAG: SDR family oxidoreductase [Proteobacteria bacterium]|nr:SDR family oxidoreductase [Pseudomonadota bacterium]